MRFLIVCALMCASAPSMATAEIKLSDSSWSVSPDFEKNPDDGKSAAKNLSGAVCAPGTNVCIAVNDEKKYAQFFRIEGTTLTPAKELLIRLLPDKIGEVKMDEIDAEGVAYEASMPPDSDFIYVIGSHGRSKSGKLQDSRFYLLRFPVDRATGLPPFPIGDEDDPDQKVERTSILRETIEGLPPLDKFAEALLDENGVNVEGLAIRNGNLNVALRSPCIRKDDGAAFEGFIMQTSLKGLFQKEASVVANVVPLQFGDNVGVRDLASVDGGFLILTGRSDDEEFGAKRSCGEDRPAASVTSALWFWDGEQNSPPVPLGDLPAVNSAEKPESLTVLAETEKYYRVLVLLDGVKNGSPKEYFISK